MARESRPRLIAAILVLLVLLGVLAAQVVRSVLGAAEPVIVRQFPQRLMGTESELFVVVPRRQAGDARAALGRATGRLRDIEAVMSVHLTASALSRLNAASGGEQVEVSEELRALLEKAGQLEGQTDGAFDATCRPVLNLWKRAGKAGKPPAQAEIDRARKLLGMRHFRIEPGKVTKLLDGAQVDLGGLAKGHAVDQATAILKQVPEAAGVMVNIGGDLRCWGRNERGQAWGVGIRHPFRPGNCGLLELTDAAVATSGDYLRYYEIVGKRYSHILDPRTGRPVEKTPSVTVVSLPAGGKQASAVEADAWATALSVLGPAGLRKISARADLEATIVTGTPDDHQVHMTAGFRRLLHGDGEIRLK